MVSTEFTAPHKIIDRLYQNRVCLDRVYLDRVYFDRVYRLPPVRGFSPLSSTFRLVDKAQKQPVQFTAINFTLPRRVTVPGSLGLEIAIAHGTTIYTGR